MRVIEVNIFLYPRVDFEFLKEIFSVMMPVLVVEEIPLN
jgi:hypothetical protein